jgi:hypothetical protein
MQNAKDFANKIGRQFKGLEGKIAEIEGLKARIGALGLVEEKLQKIKELEDKIAMIATKPIKLAEPEKFDGNQAKLNSFLATIAIYLNVNALRLPNNTAKVSFVAVYFTGKAIE